MLRRMARIRAGLVSVPGVRGKGRAIVVAEFVIAVVVVECQGGDMVGEDVPLSADAVSRA